MGMNFKICSDRIALYTKRWAIRFIRGKHWNKPELHWHFYIIPTVKVEHDYDFNYITFMWLFLTFKFEFIKVY